MQSYIYRRIEIYWDAYLSLGFQMGGVSEIVPSCHRRLITITVTISNEFEWKREECFMIRKPDPPVIIAVTKETPGRLKTTSVQILDYNLNR